MLDALELVQAEDKSEGVPSIEQMIAYADVRQTVETWIAYYHRELRLLARRGGHGYRVQGQRSPRPTVADDRDFGARRATAGGGATDTIGA